MTSKGTSSHSTHDQIGLYRPNREENEGGRQNFSSIMLKLEFPRYSKDDPTKWYNRDTILRALRHNRRPKSIIGTFSPLMRTIKGITLKLQVILCTFMEAQL